MVRVLDLMRKEREVKTSGERPSAAPRAERQAAAAPAEEACVVLMTTSEAVESLVVEIVRELGHKCLAAHSAAEAADLIRDHQADAVVIDADPNSREPVLLRRALANNEAYSNVPIVVLLAGETFRKWFDSPQRECEKVVNRPVIPAQLREALVEALSRKTQPAAPGPETPPAPAPEQEAETIDVKAAAPASIADAGTVYAEAVAAVEALVAQVDDHPPELMREAQRASEAVADCLMCGDDLLAKALDRRQPFSLAYHSANVCVFSVRIGQGLGYDEQALKRLAFAALVHDLGMCRMPQSLLMKEGTLDPEEAKLLKTHPNLTYEIILSFGEEFKWAAEIARQEHERENGTGYPNGLRGEAIHEMAKIIAVADIFEAFTHPRTFRKTFISNEALQKVIEMRGKFCDPRIIKALMDQITMFPLGSYVELNTGEIGRVVATSASNLLSPTVRIEYDSDKRPVSNPRTVDLDRTHLIFIVRPVDEEELPKADSREPAGAFDSS